MEQQDKINLLISIQNHPDEYTEEQLQQMMADDPELTELLEQLALTKQAFVKQETEGEAIPMEEEWQLFAMEHADELEALDDNEAQTSTIRTMMGTKINKAAASIIGVLFAIGAAFAAIHIVRKVAEGDRKSPTQEVRISNPHQQAQLPLSADTAKTDTIATIQPVVFDNVALVVMLPQIAAYYHKEVEFQNDDACQLRFYFEWKKDEGLDAVLHRLNLFESINVELKSDKIVVE